MRTGKPCVAEQLHVHRAAAGGLAQAQPAHRERAPHEQRGDHRVRGVAAGQRHRLQPRAQRGEAHAEAGLHHRVQRRRRRRARRGLRRHQLQRPHARLRQPAGQFGDRPGGGNSQLDTPVAARVRGLWRRLVAPPPLATPCLLASVACSGHKPCMEWQLASIHRAVACVRTAVLLQQDKRGNVRGMPDGVAESRERMRAGPRAPSSPGSIAQACAPPVHSSVGNLKPLHLSTEKHGT